MTELIKFDRSSIYQEVCCDYCNEVIHVHIDCPICEIQYAETDRYHEFYESWNDNESNIFSCCSCHSKFQVVENNWDEDYVVLQLLDEEKG